MRYTYKIYGLACVIPFGKYKGHTLKDIIDMDHGYAEWLCDTAITATLHVKTYLLLQYGYSTVEALTNQEVFPIPLN